MFPHEVVDFGRVILLASGVTNYEFLIIKRGY